MKKSELKDLIKPIVKECIEESLGEVLISSGMLSSIISEVNRGLVKSTPVKATENSETERPEKSKDPIRNFISESAKERGKSEKAPKILIGGFDPFEGTEPLEESEKHHVSGGGKGGVSLDGLLGDPDLLKKMNTLVKGKKEKK